jgi:hypothetical protein
MVTDKENALHSLFILNPLPSKPMNTLFHFAPVLESIESIILWVTKLWAIGSELITVSAILWTLNATANLIRSTYKAGLAFGKFYRKHLHSVVLTIVALIITLCILSFEGAVIVYKNRKAIMARLNYYRNVVGKQFAYA